MNGLTIFKLYSQLLEALMRSFYFLTNRCIMPTLLDQKVTLDLACPRFVKSNIFAAF